ncbi:MAG: 4'-phosphopantetheinyl transferase superfamily protein [Paludibacteraceae bacterium]|nr:4'-phosphopantetheinyl transferase superfamily protein [Paludibacteraceae bacterium]
MLLFEHILQNDTSLAVWKIEETEEELLSLFHETKELYAQEICSISNAHRRIEYLTVRALLLHLTHREPEIEHTDEGKPFLKNSSLHISISHTNQYVSVIMCPTQIVGVDIEMKKEKIFRVKDKFLSPKETIDDTQALVSLLLHWCAKETIFKLSALPLPEFSEDIIVKKFSVQDNYGKMEAYDTKQNRSYHLHYEIYDDFVLVYG